MARNGFTGPHRTRHWSEAEARGMLEELASSGESVARFAQRTGVSRSRLAYWQRRLRELSAPEFVALTLPPAAPAYIEIVGEGFVVRVREERDADEVARLAVAIGRLARRAC
jgi:transposase-like protein